MRYAFAEFVLALFCIFLVTSWSNHSASVVLAAIVGCIASFFCGRIFEGENL